MATPADIIKNAKAHLKASEKMQDLLNKIKLSAGGDPVNKIKYQ